MAWAWLATDRFEPPNEPALRIGIGDPLTGAEGFRTTHRQAALACTVASRLGESACRYDDVTIEATALTDEAGARCFVDRELGALTGAGERNQRLRDTLGCYLRTGQTAAAACAELSITDRTVAYRLRTCEEILGRPVHERAAELQVALRWGRVLSQFD
ncbi:helix-turn-helix domain-containing protein [Mycolicibacterium farcinogenes]|nr:helix-turn-helix domain-containing protein [Mycolicibacterium farcinogenes]